MVIQVPTTCALLFIASMFDSIFAANVLLLFFKKIKQSSVVGKMLSINSAYTYLNP